MFGKVRREGRQIGQVYLFVQVEETLTNVYYVGFSGQHPKNCSFCTCATL